MNRKMAITSVFNKNRLRCFTATIVVLFLVLPTLSLGAQPDPAQRLDQGDGSYSFAAPIGITSLSTIKRGALTWRYGGQAKYSWNPDPRPMSNMTYTVQPEKKLSEKESYMDLMYEDEQGSLWKVSDVDLVLARAQLSELNANSDEKLKLSGNASPTLNRPDTPMEKIGDIINITTYSWTGSSCDNHYYMGDDDRVEVDSTSSSRRRAMVEVRVSNKTACSGVIVQDDAVLTSAHCIFDDNNNLIDKDLMTVVRWDGVEPSPIHGLRGRAWDGGFTSAGTDPKDDWALLHLSTALTAPFDYMALSQASDDTLKNIDHIDNLAFPKYAPYCNSNLNGFTVQGLWLNSVGQLGKVYSRKVNLKLDGGPGHSGSPVFYCPSGSSDACSGTERAYVISVFSGWNGVETTMVGPKVAEFREQANSVLAGW